MTLSVFADTFYWIALANPNDQWHQPAKAVSKKLYPFRILTTDEVLTEFLNFLGNRGTHLRTASIKLVGHIEADPMIDVIPQSRDSFLSGWQLYQQRPDKGYSLTDCISMTTMRHFGIQDVLTHDHHFSQEGFRRLLV